MCDRFNPTRQPALPPDVPGQVPQCKNYSGGGKDQRVCNIFTTCRFFSRAYKALSGAQEDAPVIKSFTVNMIQSSCHGELTWQQFGI